MLYDTIWLPRCLPTSYILMEPTFSIRIFISWKCILSMCPNITTSQIRISLISPRSLLNSSQNTYIATSVIGSYSNTVSPIRSLCDVKQLREDIKLEDSWLWMVRMLRQHDTKKAQTSIGSYCSPIGSLCDVKTRKTSSWRKNVESVPANQKAQIQMSSRHKNCWLD